MLRSTGRDRYRLGKTLALMAAAVWGGQLSAVTWAAEPAVAAAIEAVRGVGHEGAGHREAIAGAKVLSNLPASQLPTLLAGMDGAKELPTNWFRTCVEAVAQKSSAAGEKLPLVELEKFLADQSHSPRGRRLSFELIASADEAAAKRLTATMIADPSLELRRDAVAEVAKEGEALLKDDPAKAIPLLSKAFAASRDLDQVKDLAAKLKEQKQEVDLPSHLGFLMAWHIVGPFDNIGDKGWDIAYAPESGVDLAATYDGQKEKVKWVTHETADEYGVVDLEKVLDKHKGAVSYAYTEFIAADERPADFRLGCINASKVWLNGELLGSNHVYHAGMEVDQYLMQGKLKKGKNQILVKICQNEQTEPWAQNWRFQLRVCDSIGTAILSQDRPLTKTAVLPKILR